MNSELREIFSIPADVTIKPGELHIIKPNAEKQTVKTILGSCISIIFYHPQTRASGVSHALLPSDLYNYVCERCKVCCKRTKDHSSFKYVSCAIYHLYTQFEVMRIPHSEIVVKIFGGANVFTSANIDVGSKNIQKTNEILEELKLTVTSSDTGGEVGRMISFSSEDGNVVVRKYKSKSKKHQKRKNA